MFCLRYGTLVIYNLYTSVVGT